MDKKILTAYNLKTGHKLLAIKSTTTTIGHILADVFRKRLLDKGFYEAVENMKKLEIY